MSLDRKSGYFKKELETMSSEERQEYQNRKLREIVHYAYDHAPAIKAKFDEAGVEPGDIKEVNDLEKLPITEKSALVAEQRKNLPFGGFCGIKKEQLRRIYISPGPIYEPGEDVYHDYRWTQAFYAAGFRPGDIGQITFNFNMVPFAFWLDESLRQLGCISIPAGVGNTELQIQIMKELEVTAYLGTPSFLATIADRAEEMGLDLKKDLKLQVGFVAAEMLPESLRRELEERFEMIIRQSYGTADVGCLGYECIEKNGMHFPDDCIVEIVDPATGKQLGPNETGEVVATVFDRGYPLIRFGTGDLSYYTDEPCPCGRTSPRLVKIVGRVDQLTKVRGMFVHPGQVDEVASKFPELGKCQIVVMRVKNQDKMIFRAELLEEVEDRDSLRVKVADMVKDILRVKGEVEFLSKGSIPKDAKKVDDQRKWE